MGAAVGGVGLGFAPDVAEAARKKGKKKRKKKRGKYAPGQFKRTPVLTGFDRHLANRFSYGLNPRLAKQVKQAGGSRKWFEAQLNHGRVPDRASSVRRWYPDLDRAPESVWRRQQNGSRGSWEVMNDYNRWLLNRRVLSDRQVYEKVVEFWEHHLHVPTVDEQAMWRSRYGDVIRKHALGRFDAMLGEAIFHPAMQLFLDGANSVANAPNENLAREILELHTVGRGNFGEPDVKALARLLTGFRVDYWDTWAHSYDPSVHATGAVQILAWKHANAASDGRDALRDLLRWLAHHPATAERIARKLAVKFVSDNPPASLVARLKKVYLSHGTAIKPVLRALVASPEFKRAANQKVRDPAEDVVATYRGLGTKLGRPTGDTSAAAAMIWQSANVGLAPMTWPRPDGAPADNDSWSSPARVLASFHLHYQMAGGWWPERDVRHIPARRRLPKKRKKIRFKDLVDHLSRTVLGRKSNKSILKACCLATGVKPNEKITARHALVRYRMPRLLLTLLDHPTYYRH